MSNNEKNIELVLASHEIISDINGVDILKSLERAARVCYKSEGLSTDSSAEKLISNCIKNHHESVIEHQSITVRFITDRGVTHELVRHRIASYSQESTRYCNYSSDKFNNCIKYVEIMSEIHDMTNINECDKQAIIDEWIKANHDAAVHYNNMIMHGASPQIARSVLNNSTKTEIIVTANLREWRNILKLRCATNAHPSIRKIMIPLLKELHEKIPVIFDDIYVEIFES